MGGGGGSPPPPPPECPFNEEKLKQRGTGTAAVSTAATVASWGMVPDKMYYFQDYVHSSGGGHYCKYAVDAGTLRDLNNKPIDAIEYGQMQGRVCSHNDNLALGLPGPGNQICADLNEGQKIAKDYCLKDENLETQTSVCTIDVLGGAATHGVYGDVLKAYCARPGKIISYQNCKNLNEGDYQRFAAAHCAANPSDSFCSCYNIMNDVCKSNSNAAGCAEKRNKFDKLVAGTPDGQKQVWSGLEKCFGGVCSGAGKYLPPGHDLRCNSSVNVCVQNVEVGSLNDSGMNIVCDIDSSSGSDVSDGGGGGGAGVGAGAGAGAGVGDTPTVSVSDFKSNPRSYIPKSLDGLKNDTRQKTGAAIGGTVFLSFASALLLLVLIMSMGGGGRRRLRR